MCVYMWYRYILVCVCAPGVQEVIQLNLGSQNDHTNLHPQYQVLITTGAPKQLSDSLGLHLQATNSG